MFLHQSPSPPSPLAATTACIHVFSVARDSNNPTFIITSSGELTFRRGCRRRGRRVINEHLLVFAHAARPREDRSKFQLEKTPHRHACGPSLNIVYFVVLVELFLCCEKSGGAHAIISHATSKQQAIDRATSCVRGEVDRPTGVSIMMYVGCCYIRRRAPTIDRHFSRKAISFTCGGHIFAADKLYTYMERRRQASPVLSSSRERDQSDYATARCRSFVGGKSFKSWKLEISVAEMLVTPPEAFTQGDVCYLRCLPLHHTYTTRRIRRGDGYPWKGDFCVCAMCDEF